MTGAPSIQTITKEIDAPSEEIAIHRAQSFYPNQQFVQTTATLMDPQSQAPTGTPGQTQQTTSGRMRGLTPLRALAQPGQPQPQQQQQQQVENQIRYPYSITLPSRFARLLNETSPVEVSERHGQHQIVLENVADMKGFLSHLARHRDRDGAEIILDGIRSSV